jgi:ADP-heptose:LPS heptosyltransferase
MHTLDRQAEQLGMAGIAVTPPPDASWLTADIGRFGLRPPFALLAPGGSADRPAKRWPVERYAALARGLAARGITPVVLGTAPERPLAAAIVAATPGTRDLTSQTSLGEIAALARAAVVAVGNDSGPMHLIAVAGAPAVVLFSAESDPALCAPRAPAVRVLRRLALADLPAAEVEATLRSISDMR